MYTCFSLIFFIFIVFNYQQVSTRGGRGGGGRSGGSRGGSSRSGSRSSSSGRIGFSSRYSMWSSRHGFSSTFRYRTASSYNIRNGIYSGLILTSYRYKTTFVVRSDQQYSGRVDPSASMQRFRVKVKSKDISICYNESPLYERNISVSPWFVCPWDDPSYSYCCGDEIEERCCTFFEKPGFLTTLIMVCLFLPVSFVLYYFYKRPKKKSSSENLSIDNAYNENPNLVQLPPTITPNLENVDIKSTQITNSDEQCPLYPVQNYADPTTFTSTETLPVENFPTTLFNINNTSNLPYPADPINPMSQSQCPQFNSLSYDDSGPQYSLIPPEHPPPSYSDVVKENKY